MGAAVAQQNVIVLIEQHHVKSGETLAGLAVLYGLTWQQLALFNWNTSDPDEINNHLRDDVGCTALAPDGRNYIFSNDDSPGIIHIPKKWARSGLATDRRHTIHVRRFEKVPAEEAYVISVEVRSIGGTLLVNHDVRILDPDNLEQVGDLITTGDDGLVRAVVPQNKTYRIEIADAEAVSVGLPLDGDEEPAMLLCHFFDESGAPCAHQDIVARSGNDTFELATDAEGKIEAPAHLVPYELRIGNQVFHAHALLSKDREKDGNRYRFIVASNEASEDGACGTDRDDCVPHYEILLDDEGASA